jgi:hypothetical protein
MKEKTQETYYRISIQTRRVKSPVSGFPETGRTGRFWWSAREGWFREIKCHPSKCA